MIVRNNLDLKIVVRMLGEKNLPQPIQSVNGFLY